MADKKPVKKSTNARKVYTYYSVSGSAVTRKKRTCPKCGDGFCMSDHKDRFTCGRCGYTEFKK